MSALWDGCVWPPCHSTNYFGGPWPSYFALWRRWLRLTAQVTDFCQLSGDSRICRLTTVRIILADYRHRWLRVPLHTHRDTSDCKRKWGDVYLNNRFMPDISAVKSMSAQEAKIRHQREYQERVEAVRKGQAPGRVLEKRPDDIVPAKDGRSLAFF